MIKNLLSYGFAGSVYPINPKETEVCGLKCYPSVLDVPSQIDLGIILISAALIAPAITELGEKGVKSAIIYSGGFSESGTEGRKLEEAVLRISEKFGIRIVGPNCTGIVSTSVKLPWTRPSTELPVGDEGVAFISQSGSMTGSYASLAATRGLKFSKIISVGNEADLTSVDFLEYLGNDSKTKLIVMLMEAVKDGKRFVQVAKNITKSKPIIVWKVGRTVSGSTAARSHTGSIAGQAEIYSAAFKQCGIVEATDFEEMVDYSVGFSFVQEVCGRRVAIITGPGGPGIALADSCEEANLDIPQYDKETANKLRLTIPTIHTTANPTNTELTNFESLKICMEIIAADENVDTVLLAGPTELWPQEFAKMVISTKSNFPKPLIVAWFAGGKGVENASRQLEQSGIPVYHSAKRAAITISALAKYQQHRRLDRPS